MRVAWVIALLGLALARGAFALGKIRVTSDAPAYVAMKGRKLGRAPLTLHDLRRGTYELTITSLWTGETKMFRVSIPAIKPVTRNVAARFAPERPVGEATIASENRIAAKYARQERVGGPMRMAIGAPAPAHPSTVQRWVDDACDRVKDAYTRRHMVSGGVALLGAAVGSGVVAGIGLGGAIMNEVIHRDGAESRSRSALAQ